jgi:hypothetical protein
MKCLITGDVYSCSIFMYSFNLFPVSVYKVCPFYPSFSILCVIELSTDCDNATTCGCTQVFNHMGYLQSLAKGNAGFCDCSSNFSESILRECNGK